MLSPGRGAEVPGGPCRDGASTATVHPGRRTRRGPPMRLTTRRRTATAAFTSAALVAMAGVGALLAAPAQAATGCKVEYKVTNQWPSGFGGDVVVTNLGDAVSGWKLGWSFGAGQQITQAWGGNATQSGAAVTISNASWNGSLSTGATAQVGFNASWSGSNPVPTSFTLNGVTCTAARRTRRRTRPPRRRRATRRPRRLDDATRPPRRPPVWWAGRRRTAAPAVAARRRPRR